MLNNMSRYLSLFSNRFWRESQKLRYFSSVAIHISYIDFTVWYLENKLLFTSIKEFYLCFVSILNMYLIILCIYLYLSFVNTSQVFENKFQNNTSLQDLINFNYYLIYLGDMFLYIAQYYGWLVQYFNIIYWVFFCE